MSKIFKLKKWLSLEDAAKRLSLELEEEVSVGDVLQLCVDEELKISVNFPHDWKGIICDVTTDKEKAMSLYQDIYLDGEAIRIYEYEQCSDNEYIKKFNKANFNSGIYEVKLIGNSKLDLEFELKKEKNLPLVDVICLSGFYLLDENKTVIERQTTSYNPAYCDIKTKKEFGGSFDYPCAGISEIEGAFFVIQSKHINEFMECLNDEQSSVSEPKEITGKSETSYLNIIKALCRLILKDGKNRNQTWLINTLISENPNTIGISESNLKNKFAEMKLK